MSLMERVSESRSVAYRPISIWSGVRAFFTIAKRLTKNRLAFNNIADLDDAMLKDIGLDRSEVERAYNGSLLVDPMHELQNAALTRAKNMTISKH